MYDTAQKLFAELRRQIPSLEAVPQPDLRAAVERVLRRLDLVSREEFEAQAAVLARTRERLEALEAQVAELEQGDVANPPPEH